MSLPHQGRRFLNHVLSEADGNGVTVSLLPMPHIYSNGTPCGGYFSSETNTIAVATDRPYRVWMPTLVHEYGHFMQWRESCQIWKQQDLEGTDVGSFVDYWLSGRVELNWHQREKYFGLVRELELDCEQRAVEIAEEWDLAINRIGHIVQANSYIFFHEVASRNRVWVKPKSFTDHERQLRRLCPHEFLSLEEYADMETWCDLHDFLLENCSVSLL